MPALRPPPIRKRHVPKAPARLLVLAGLTTAMLLAGTSSWAANAGAAAAAARRANSPYPHFYLPHHHKFCGSGWQAAYRQRHAAVVSNATAPRFLRARPLAGLGHSLNGALTLFYVALLTDRALLIHGLPDASLQEWVDPGMTSSMEASYEWAFDAPNIDWGWNALRLADFPTYQAILGWGDRPGAREGIDDNGRALARAIKAADLRQFQPDVAVMDVVSAFLATDALFDNPHHKKQLFAWGLRPETALGCAFHYLLKPTQAMAARFGGELERMADPRLLKIALHGGFLPPGLTKHDRLAGGEAPRCPVGASCPEELAGLSVLDTYYEQKHGHFFRCAQDLEQRYARAGQPVVWYVVSDNLGFGQFAKRRYGTKVLTTTPEDKLLPDLGQYNHSNVEQSKETRGFEAAAAKYIAYAQADYHILTGGSAFSSGAALVGLKWQSRVHLDLELQDPGAWRGCVGDLM